MRIAECAQCHHFACVCVTQRRHDEKCKFRISATCPVGIACEHGRDTCPICDPCTCGATVTPEDIGSKVLFDRWSART